MDAVQAAKSGHPGTPMALAPVAYCLWQRLLGSIRPSDLAEPRSVRPVGRHARCCCTAMLHLTGVRAVNPEYETLGDPS
jgi:transketolase